MKYDTTLLRRDGKEATVIPIPKPNKDHTDPTYYRPIALTSCICKTMERMITDRLTANSHGLFPHQFLIHMSKTFRLNWVMHYLFFPYVKTTRNSTCSILMHFSIKFYPIRR